MQEMKLTKHVNRTQFKSKDLLVPWKPKNNSIKENSEEAKEFHRFLLTINNKY